jgi:predicted outer membrane repeat protein
MKLLLLMLSLLVLNGFASQAFASQAQDLNEITQSDIGLNESYASPCTSLNDTEFSSLPRPGLHLQKLVNEADDGLSVSIPSGYYPLSPGETIHIAKNLTLVGDGLVIIDARREGSILSLDNPRASVDIIQIAFVNGKGDYGGAITSNARSLILHNCSFIDNLANYGAGVYQDGGGLSVDNSVFAHNYAACKGGAIYSNASNTGSPLVVKGCKFYRNNVVNIGAAICIEHNKFNIESSEFSRNSGTAALYASNSSVSLSDCNIHDNLGPNNMRQNGCGGGVGFDNCSASIENCVIRGNKAAYLDNDGNLTPEYWGFGGSGGGIYLLRSDVTINDTSIDENDAFTAGGLDVSESNLVVNKCSISNNTARYVTTPDGSFNGQGGGMFIWSGSEVTLNGVILDRNHGDGRNGAIHNSGILHLTDKTVVSKNTAPRGAGISNNGVLSIDGDVVISNNTANEGAGIFNWGDGQVEMRGNTKLMNNHAAENGGAIYNKGSLCLNGATILGNNATYGSAIYNKGNLTLLGGEVRGNIASIGGSIWNARNMTLVGVKIEDMGRPVT